MIRNKIIQLLLSPFSLLYGFVISLRNFSYRYGLLKGVEFNLPVISVGNLTIGGAGKTPHIEYLIRLLKDYINIATLSRGYGRKTSGFFLVHHGNTAEQVGDEPLQFRRKFPEILVGIGENRTFAIPQLLMDEPDLQLILLDDAFQHRSVKPGLNILLTEYSQPFSQDFLLPAGRLREWRSAYHRADVIIVSKCPYTWSDSIRQKMLEALQPLPYQTLYFSYYEYDAPFYIFNRKNIIPLQANWTVLLVSAIARTEYLVDYLEEQVDTVKLLQYEDHHYFSNYDVSHIKKMFENIEAPNKIILTTEKDAMRLELHRKYLLEHRLPILVLPVRVAFHEQDGQKFDDAIKEYLLDFKA